MNFNSLIFKDYDVRGRYPDEVNSRIFRLIAQEIGLFFKPKQVAIGRDVRLSSQNLAEAMMDGFASLGIEVIDLGLITTDMIYFAAGKYRFDLNIVVTGSHAEGENGFKICRQGAVAIGGENGLYKIKERLLKRKQPFKPDKQPGKIINRDILNDWVQHALGFVDLKIIRPFKIVVDTGNGMGGLVMPPIENKLPGKFVNLYFKLDGHFPHHFPNPLIKKNSVDIERKVKAVEADFGIAFDGDGDRVFFFDQKGKMITGTILTAMLAKAILQKNKNETILYNAVCGRIVPEIIKKYGGKGIRVRVGHSLIKREMRKYKAIFAGEHSGHFYFRDNFYADSGLIAALKTIELVSRDGRSFSQITKEFSKYCPSGEINFIVDGKEKVIKAIEQQYQGKASSIDWLDGLSVWFPNWWFNLRASHTEPLLRLNVEANSPAVLQEKTEGLKLQLKKLKAKIKR